MNNIKKKLITLLSIGFIILPLAGCSANSFANDRFEIIDTINQSFATYEVRDKKTGVHYYVDYENKLCPVYNFNGTIKSTTKTNN